MNTIDFWLGVCLGMALTNAVFGIYLLYVVPRKRKVSEEEIWSP